MQTETHQTLWQNILQFSLDDPFATVKFSDKLAAQNNWTPAFTLRAINEYKRFIFLCCTAPNGASPSPVVDEVWHLHLTYTQNYWKEFCAGVLGKEIHHHPSKGGPSEKGRHQRWYAETLQLYKDVFGEEPPLDIWPPSNLSNTNSQLLFDETKEPNYANAYKKYIYVLLLPFLIPFFFGRLHPFSLTGPQFLFFYAALLCATLVYLLLTRIQKRNLIEDVVNNNTFHDANVYALARFVFGKTKAIETAIVDLVSKGILMAERSNRFTFYPAKADAETIAQNPLAKNLLLYCKGDGWLTMNDMLGYYNEDLTYHAGLSSLYQNVTKKDWRPFLLSGAVILLGIVRMIQGVHNGYPVHYLQMMMLFGGIILLVIALTLSAKGLLERLFIAKYDRNELTLVSQETVLPSFLFFGAAVLASNLVFANLERTFRDHRPAGNASVSSCGSSGCGSSCGSSCGGGCGGCGGGD